MSLYQDCSDSIKKIDTQTKGSYIEKVHNTEKEVVKANVKIGYMIGVFCIGILIVFLSVKKLNKKNKKKIKEKEEVHVQQKEGYRKEILLKKRDALLHKIEQGKQQHADDWKKAGIEDRNRISIDLYNDLLHLNDTLFFYQEMDTVLNNLVTKLKTRYPAITDKEIHWCCFHLLQIPTYDMLLLLDYKVDSLKRMKQRLVKKTGLSGARELDEFLLKILAE